MRMESLYSSCFLIVVYLVTLSVCGYQFDIDPAGGAIEGYVVSNAKEGAKVPITLVEGRVFEENGKEVQYLQVIVRSGARNGSEKFVLENTDAFRMDNDGYILVNNTGSFGRYQVIEFYVVMFRGDLVVSDPVPFIVRVQKRTEDTTYMYD